MPPLRPAIRRKRKLNAESDATDSEKLVARIVCTTGWKRGIMQYWFVRHCIAQLFRD